MKLTDKERRKVIFAMLATWLGAQHQTVTAEPIGISGFSQFGRRQKTPVWCWAAVIESLLNYRGVTWNQEDVVGAMKGILSITTATDQEITRFLNSQGFDINGRPWLSRADFFGGAPSPKKTVREFRGGYPIIMQLQLSPAMYHVIIAYSANVVAKEGGPDQFLHLFYIDPIDGEVHMMTGKQFQNDVLGHWIIRLEMA